MACEEIVDEFNDLRSDIVLLFDLKNALNSAEYELQTSLHRLKSENGPISAGILSTQPLSASSNSSNDTPRTVNIRFCFIHSLEYLFSISISYYPNPLLQRILLHHHDYRIHSNHRIMFVRVLV